jgi:hypothetical protein
MGKIDDLLTKLFRKKIPKDITWGEVRTLVIHFGCDVKQGGKHPKVIDKESGTIIPISAHNEGSIIPEYNIKQLKDLIDSKIERK